MGLMHDCVVKNDIDGLRQALAEDPDLLEKWDASGGGYPPLAMAAKRGREECLAALIDAGADLEATGEDKKTALIHAAERGREGCAAKLVESGARVDAEDDNQHTALMWSCREGHASLARALIERGADVNHHSKHGNTALLWAIEGFYEDCVEALIQAGVDIHASNDFGTTPMGHAKLKGGRAAGCLRLLEDAVCDGEMEAPWKRSFKLCGAGK